MKIAGISAAGLAALPGFSLFYTSSKECATDLIMNEFKFLKISKDEVIKYVNEFYTYHPVNESKPWQMKIKLHHYFNVKTVRSLMLVEGFLPATDFFMNKMDENRQINYVGMYNPYKRPCANPFSFIYYPFQQQADV